MKIGIIVHSQTGTTRKFADKIAGRLKADGHLIDLTQIETDVPIKSRSARLPQKFAITNLPDITEYDTVLLGGPVWGFSASIGALECIKAFGELKEKQFLPFVTMGFPFKFMGGKQAITLMSRKAADKNATILPGFVVSKLFHDFERDMDEAAVVIASLLKPAV